MEDVDARGLIRAWLPVVLYCATIFILSAVPAHQMPDGHLWRLDKLIHAVVYGGLALLLWRALCMGPPRLGRRGAAVVAILGATLFGISDEWHQSFVPGRQASVLDAVADLIGAAAAVLGAALAWPRR